MAVTVRLPLTVEAPRSMAPVSLSDTFRPLTTLTAPPKLLESLSVMSLAEPAVRVVVPATDRLPLSVIEPLAVTARLPLIETLPSVSPLDSVTENDPLEAPVTVATLVVMATEPLAAVALSRSPVIRPLPLMFPAVALSATLEPEVMD